MFNEFNIWQVLAGLGIFLFGMSQLEEALRKIAGRSFKRFLRNNTNTRFRSILSGTITTMVLQSSSVVSLMTIAFVGAQLIPLENAIGIIMGANLGTTFTGWIVATLGFKVEIETFALPFIAIGGFALMFLNKNEKLANYGKFLIGFGFLFLGLSFIKDTFDHITETFDIEKYANHGTFVFLLLGTGITALIQSSSATTIIVLSALNSNIITFDSAVGMVIGANLGTTVTAILGGIGKNAAKKQAALSHFYFNLITAIIAFVLINPLIYFIHHYLNIQDNLYALAAFHTLFNLIGIIIFYPFIAKFAGFLRKTVKEKEFLLTKFINKVRSEEVYEALISVKNEVYRLAKYVIIFNLKSLNINIENLNKDKEPDDKIVEDSLYTFYENLKSIELAILEYYGKIESEQMSEQESKLASHLIASLRDAVYSAKMSKDILHDIEQMQMSGDEKITGFYAHIQKQQQYFYTEVLNVFNNLINNPQKISIDELSELKTINKSINEELLQLVIEKKIPLNHPDISAASILNAIRAIYDSNKFILKAIDEFYEAVRVNA
ncbi:MAG TPA: sodium:phosphate symporter [Flavobacteriales bacterium]|nr:sodium:phosphate symporter [Flavobacteriales bacterium]|tara:strand:+ start:80339 stop:81991 length:1653 start_codon:yes stop_codon:yes gene_type:complete